MAVEATHPNQSIPFPWSNIQDVQQQIPFYGVPSSTMVQPNLTVGTAENVQRKRPREFLNQFNQVPSFFESQATANVGSSSQFSPFFVEPAGHLSQLNQHQFEIDSIISQNAKKMRMELQEKQKQHAKLLISTIGQKAITKIKEKDEQIHKMGTLNMALQERIKSLLMENQLWRGVAQNNEAQVRSLRANLEQAMAQVEAQQDRVGGGDDVESCCGSNAGDVASGGWKCKRCGEGESTVLVLPCRHLCLCNTCGSGAQSVQVCPVCQCGMSGTLHVNMSP